MTLKITTNIEGDTLQAKHILAQDYGFHCSGGNTSPAIYWEGLPEDTKSVAITCYDPDAPTGSGWWHWIVLNIPPHITHLDENSGYADNMLPDGAMHVVNDCNRLQFMGACPPPTDDAHRYIFTVHACSTTFDFDSNIPSAVARFSIELNTIEKASITYLYKYQS